MLRSRSIPGRMVARGSVIALAALTLVVPISGAQTPTTGTAAHPAHIHAGTCAELGEVVFPLTDVAVETGDMIGAADAHPLAVSVTVLPDVSFDDIIAGEHAVNVHLSADEIGTYIACGNIGGVVSEREEGNGSEVAFGLAPLNDSGYAGTVWIGDDGNGGTIVSIQLLDLAELGASGS